MNPYKPGLTEAGLPRTSDWAPVHTGQPQPLECPCVSREIFTGHVPDHLDQRVDRRRLYPRCCADCAHRDKTGWNVFSDELVVERFRSASRLIRPIAVVGQALAGLDERRL